MKNFLNFKLLSFDCYGTLVDWEKGIVESLEPFLVSRGVVIDDEQLLEMYAKYESEIENGTYIEYKEVLVEVFNKICGRLSIRINDREKHLLLESFANWEPFPDTISALKSFKKNFKLAIISNVDDDLFKLTQKKLDVEFDYVITAQQVKSYKPSTLIFKYALEKFGISKEHILHIAQSIYHDIVPAKSLGITTVWVNRRKGRKGSGATPPAQGKPDLEVPDLAVLANLIENTNA
ncbi:MAG: haloacid dehalogenase type II [Candidatus Kapaibacteriota bacterium]